MLFPQPNETPFVHDNINALVRWPLRFLGRHPDRYEIAAADTVAFSAALDIIVSAQRWYARSSARHGFPLVSRSTNREVPDRTSRFSLERSRTRSSAPSTSESSDTGARRDTASAIDARVGHERSYHDV
jgi:hypothetical protein